MGMGTGQQCAICWHTDGALDAIAHSLGERQADAQQVQADQDYLGVTGAQEQKLGEKRIMDAQAFPLAGGIPVKTASHRRGNVDLDRAG
jgi:hypothetical protein